MKTCPVCSSAELNNVIEIRNVPVYCNVLWKSREEALQSAQGDILLSFCRTCGHLFNRAFDPELMKYTADYENSLHFSPRFQAYAEALANELIAKYDLHDSKIVEIACGKGDFLRLLCRLGGNRGLGFDPSYEFDRHDMPLSDQVEVVAEYFTEKSLPWDADLICCRHALEHIKYPTEFLSGLRQTIGDSSPALFFEVPNALYTLRDYGIWDLIYEHCSYFWAGSLYRSFRSAGFDVAQVEEAFGSQYLCLDAQIDHEERGDGRDYPVAAIEPLVEGFEENFRGKVTAWSEQLKRMCAQGKKIVVWGSGSKGVTFLNLLKTAEVIPYVVDLNPKKQGRFVPGTGQAVVAPIFLAEYRPDVVILMNDLYRDEVSADLDNLGLNVELLSA